MRKALVLVVAVLLAICVTGLLLVFAFFGHIPLGEPKLRIEFDPPPPWQVRAGHTFEVGIGIANDAWLLAAAKDIRVDVSMPEGFISSRTGTNECEIYFGALHGGDGLGNTLSVMVSSNVSSGNYTISIRVLGENFPEKISTPQVMVLAA